MVQTAAGLMLFIGGVLLSFFGRWIVGILLGCYGFFLLANVLGKAHRGETRRKKSK